MKSNKITPIPPNACPQILSSASLLWLTGFLSLPEENMPALPPGPWQKLLSSPEDLPDAPAFQIQGSRSPPQRALSWHTPLSINKDFI